VYAARSIREPSRSPAETALAVFGACLGLSAPRSVLLTRFTGRIVRATFHGKEVGTMDLLSFIRDDDGQGLVEYALIIAVIAIAVIVAMIFLKGQIQNIFSNIGNNLT